MDYTTFIRSATIPPDRLEHPGPWSGHVPFALWLVPLLKPGIIVELGTHLGTSYFNFCRAAKFAGYGGKCYAIDTWQGDEHAGHYDETVFADVNKHNELYYSELSCLLRMTFDEALAHFSDSSIELLHIDGLHTYEAVKHDFETWLPKLAPSAVVLFHDTRVCERGFGVRQLWEELQERYPLNLEFVHSYGLGVLQLAPGEGHSCLDFLRPGASEKQLLVDYFGVSGTDLDRYQAASRLERELTQAVAERDAQIANLNRLVADYRGLGRSRDSVAEASDLEIAEYNLAFSELAEEIPRLQIANQAAQARISSILSSRSWRVTAPLRALQPIARFSVPRPIRTTLRAVLSMTRRLGQARHNERGDNSASPRPGTELQGNSDYLGSLKRIVGFGTGYPTGLRIHGDLRSAARECGTVLIVSHDATRTGAPIVALNIAQQLVKRYKIVALLLGGGNLIDDFNSACDVVIGPFEPARDPGVARQVLSCLVRDCDVQFAIVNSIESRSVLAGLASLFVPAISVIHEFSSERPGAVTEAVLWANEVVFSAEIVRVNAEQECAALAERPAVILPQGKVVVPGLAHAAHIAGADYHRMRRAFRPASLADHAVVVMGAGTVDYRKGVDLFLACAARVAALQPQRSYRFVWVGRGYDPVNDRGYSVYLRDQVSRAGLGDSFAFVGELADFQQCYQLADILFISSRLDPLPNVAIEAICSGLPVVCFDRATGIADILNDNDCGEACVAPYLDVEQAAERLVHLIDDPTLRRDIGQRIKPLALGLFNLPTYVDALERLAQRCCISQDLEKKDCALIADAGLLRRDFFVPAMSPEMSIQEAVRLFVRSWASGVGPRKPFPGFHPGIYLERHGVKLTNRDPFADFLEAGKPTGPWSCPLVEHPAAPRKAELELRVALHVHAYYLALLPDILQRLGNQGRDLDLLISVSTQTAVSEAKTMLEHYGFTSGDVRLVPNRGRDIGPLLTEFGPLIRERYDIIGHVHTKKTLDFHDQRAGQIWRRFLLEGLIGGKGSMAQTIIQALAADDDLGLVFPDDPNAVGWNGNKDLADGLASRLGIVDLPERHFWFPVGTMFWAKVSAIIPLLDLGLDWEDYPKEPLPYDGTILHAIERLLPFVVRKAGYGMALTHVPGVTR